MTVELLISMLWMTTSLGQYLCNNGNNKSWGRQNILEKAMSKHNPCTLDQHEIKMITSAQRQSSEWAETIVKCGCLQVIGVIQMASPGIGLIGLTVPKRKIRSALEDMRWFRWADIRSYWFFVLSDWKTYSLKKRTPFMMMLQKHENDTLGCFNLFVSSRKTALLLLELV